MQPPSAFFARRFAGDMCNLATRMLWHAPTIMRPRFFGFEAAGASVAVVLVCALGILNSTAADQDWPAVGGDKGCSRYSTLDQINRRNVNMLQVAWIYHTKDSKL